MYCSPCVNIYTLLHLTLQDNVLITINMTLNNVPEAGKMRFDCYTTALYLLHGMGL